MRKGHQDGGWETQEEEEGEAQAGGPQAQQCFLEVAPGPALSCLRQPLTPLSEHLGGKRVGPAPGSWELPPSAMLATLPPITTH